MKNFLADIHNKFRAIRVALRNLFLCVFIFVVSYPKTGMAVNIGLDPSWMYALNYFFTKKMLFGEEVMFTYGPLGFLLCPQAIGNNLLIGIWFHFVVYTLLVCGIAYLAIPVYRERKAIPVIAYTLFICWVLVKNGQSLVFMQNLLIPVLILNYETSRKLIFIIFASAIVSFLFLIKTGMGIIGALLLGSYLMLKLVFERRYKLFFGIISFVIFLFLSVWFLIYRSFHSLPGFVFSSIQFVRGNASAASIGSASSLAVVYFLVTLAAILLLVFLLKEKTVSLVSGIFFLPLCVMFKYAFGRQDEWHTAAFLTFLLSYVFLVVMQAMTARKRMIFIAVLSFSLVLFLKIDGTPSFVGYITQGVNIRGNINNFYQAIFQYASYKEQLEDESRENLEKQSLSQEVLEKIQKDPIDIYPWDATYGPANNLNWRPRPVFQSYAAYTPWLDKVNFNFLKSDRAPIYILWITQRQGQPHESIDRRYLLNDEPRTIYEIFNHYEPILHDGKAVLLRRKEKLTFKQSSVSYVKQYAWNQWIDVPFSDVSCVRAQVKFRRSLPGVLKRILWKEGGVFITYKFIDGRMTKHRLVIDHAAVGIWVHPYITDLSLALKNGAEVSHVNLRDRDNLFYGRTVVQVKFSCDDKNAFDPYFTLAWEKIDFNK